MGQMSNLDIILRETQSDLKGMEMRLQKIARRIESAYGS